MTAQWTRASDGQFRDLPLGAAWLARAELLAGSNANDAPGQRQIATDTFAAFGNACKALNSKPRSIAAWDSEWRAAYGTHNGPVIVPTSRESTATLGALAAAALTTYSAIHPTDRTDIDIFVRAWLDVMGRPMFHCLDTSSAASPECNLSGLFSGRAPLCVAIAGQTRACTESHPWDSALNGAGPTDWRYVLWNDAWGARLRIAPPLRDSVAMVGRAVRAMRAVDISSVRGEPMFSAAVGLPPSNIPDPPGWTRPAVLMPVMLPGIVASNPAKVGAVIDMFRPPTNTPTTPVYSLRPPTSTGLSQDQVVEILGRDGELCADWHARTNEQKVTRVRETGYSGDAAAAIAVLDRCVAGTPAPTAPDCTLPGNPAYLVQEATLPGATPRSIDPYFSSATHREAWIAAHQNCPVPPPFVSPPSPEMVPTEPGITSGNEQVVATVPAATRTRPSIRTIALVTVGAGTLAAATWYALRSRAGAAALVLPLLFLLPMVPP